VSGRFCIFMLHQRLMVVFHGNLLAEPGSGAASEASSMGTNLLEPICGRGGADGGNLTRVENENTKCRSSETARYSWRCRNGQSL
jgi:hypothetical protein